MKFRRSSRKLDFSKKRQEEKKKSKSPWVFILFLIIIILPSYRFYLRYSKVGIGLKQEMQIIEKNFKSKCKVYFENSFSGIVLEVVTADDDLYPRQFILESGEFINPTFQWHNVGKLQPQDSIYKAPNSFSLEVYRGENHKQHFTLEKFESQTCD